MTRRQRKRRAERQARQRRGAAAIDGVLRLESLETRQLLAITANPRSVEDAAAEILSHTPNSATPSIKHVTVVTHGFQPQLVGSGDSLLPLAEKIYTRADADKAWLPIYRPCMANNSAGTKLGAASHSQILSLEVVLFKGGRSNLHIGWYSKSNPVRSVSAGYGGGRPRRRCQGARTVPQETVKNNEK